MKSLAFAAALLIGTAAVAQSTTTTPPDSTMPSTGTMDASPTAPTDSTGTPPPAPGGPEAPAPTPGPGTMDSTQGDMGANNAMQSPMATPTAPGQPVVQPIPAEVANTGGTYPRCSATVTDQCRQATARSETRAKRRRPS